MNLYKKRYLYANGTSVTAGGGFEPASHRKDNVRPLYKLKGIDLPEKQVECSYPFFVAKKLNLELINNAKCGSGIDRLVRTTFDWIHKNPDKVDQTIFLLELQPGIRLDWYVNEWRDYGVLNAHFDQENKVHFSLVKTWYMDDKQEQHEWQNKYKSIIEEYLPTFFDEGEHYSREIRLLIAFLGFLNDNKIDYVASLPGKGTEYQDKLQNIVPRKSNLSYKLGDNIWGYATKNKLLISDEIDDRDNHISYTGNQIVADLIVDYIKHYQTITYFAPRGSTISHHVKNIFVKNLPIKFVKVENIDDADFIDLDEFSIFRFRDMCTMGTPSLASQEYIKEINDKWPFLRTIDLTNKRFFITLHHERVSVNVFLKWLLFLEKEYNIKRSQIWYVDVSVSDYPGANPIPLELKLRNFASLDEFELYDDMHYRDKKICSLTNKISPLRTIVFDQILNAYSDHNQMQDENIISMLVDYGDIENVINRNNIESKLKNSMSRYKEIGLPWILDIKRVFWPHRELNKQLNNLIEMYKRCIISISCETELFPHHQFLLESNTNDINNLNSEHQKLNEIQFSEKSILPIIGGVFMFTITDGSFYRNMEKIGFDFSYLKKLFNIDYLTNTHYENMSEVTKIMNFVTNKSIHELNQFRKDNYHYIEHNRSLLLDILLGDSTENELKFWEQLSGKSLRNKILSNESPCLIRSVK